MNKLKLFTLQLALLFPINLFAQEKVVDNITIDNEGISYYLEGVKKPFSVLFISDTHITIEDERGRNFYEYSKRMGGAAVEPENYGKSNGREASLLASLEKAKANNTELVILAGDIINFPSLASVEMVKNIMDNSGLNWAYTAGNHDWHYEGEEGTSAQLRNKWIHSNLKELYQNENPLFASQVINGINFITLDNSTYEITPEQFKFFEEQLKKEQPIILSLHIPLYIPGESVYYGCGNPEWNKANDGVYELERRLPWPEAGHSETTYKFHNLVFDCNKVIGIFAGHTHERKIHFHKSVIQMVNGTGFDGHDILINFNPKENN